MIVHLVLLKLKDDVTKDDLESFAQLSTRALSTIPSVRRAIVGRKTDIDVGYARNFGETTYDLAAVLEFDDRDGLREYLEHPLHAELGARFWTMAAVAVVFEGAMEKVDVR